MRSRPPSLTRRQWAGLLAVSPLAGTPLFYQATSSVPPTGSPKPAVPTATAEQRLAKAYADIRQISDRLAQIQVPMNVEPAFSFKP